MHPSGMAAEGDTKLLVALYHPEPAVAARIAAAVVAAGYAVDVLPDPDAGLRPWLGQCFDLLLLGSPVDATAADALAAVRLARSVAGRRPLFVLTDRDSRDARLTALSGGADDALGWRGNLPEVTARIAALLRRSLMAAGQLGVGDLRIDLIDRRVERAGQLIRMPQREFDLLAHLARVPGRPMSRAALLKAVWRIDFDPGTNRVEVHVARLRAKIDRGFDWPMLHTIKGEGYALHPHRGVPGLTTC
ncbi:response regulator transcription factor [Sphingopyxis terrae]|uniref:Two-component system, OmpR family, response regulator n=1 Tax=Sphingopyxis terrae subsp. ummariensis TaxID=429001 RepID=A0A1Y6ELB2_9SPHN|nr:response regulator transcription factor [Sphingopyxis terrae]SMQ61740.1 two-component system, OmpR family, response regulator [Sphingopyxis terrae subsp. ummariensis]